MAELKKEHRKKLAEWIDLKLNLDGFWEMIDGLAANTLLRVINDKFILRVPVEYEEDINSFVEAVYLEDREAVCGHLANIATGIIPTPLIDGTEEEKQVYRTALDFLLSLIPSKKE